MIWTFLHFTGDIETSCNDQIGVCLSDAGSEAVSYGIAAVCTLNRSGRYIHKLLQWLVVDRIVSALVSVPLTVKKASLYGTYSGTSKCEHAGTVSAAGFQGHFDDCAQVAPD